MSLKINSLGVEAREGWPVWDVNLELPGGAIGGIAGPQGSGKSTLLRLAAGLVTADRGRVLLGGVDLVRDPIYARRHTGYVAEEHGFYTDMTAGDYLAFMAACHGVPRSEQEALVTDLLEVVDLAGSRRAAIATLSRGMRQRLALARALVHDPDLMLADDLAAGLDPRSRLEIFDLLRELRDMGKTVLLCTTDIEDLADLASHVGIINGGRLVVWGSREDVLALGRKARLLEIRVAGDPEPVAERLRATPLVRAVSVEGNNLKVAYLGGDGSVQTLLAALVRGGTPVLGFLESRGGLSEAFRQVTGG